MSAQLTSSNSYYNVSCNSLKANQVDAQPSGYNLINASTSGIPAGTNFALLNFTGGSVPFKSLDVNYTNGLLTFTKTGLYEINFSGSIFVNGVNDGSTQIVLYFRDPSAGGITWNIKAVRVSALGVSNGASGSLLLYVDTAKTYGFYLVNNSSTATNSSVLDVSFSVLRVGSA